MLAHGHLWPRYKEEGEEQHHPVGEEEEKSRLGCTFGTTSVPPPSTSAKPLASPLAAGALPRRLAAPPCPQSPNLSILYRPGHPTKLWGHQFRLWLRRLATPSNFLPCLEVTALATMSRAAFDEVTTRCHRVRRGRSRRHRLRLEEMGGETLEVEGGDVALEHIVIDKMDVLGGGRRGDGQ